MEFPKTNYSYCEHSSINGLELPDVDFWPIYSWSWLGEITNEGIVQRLDEMLERGIKRLYILPIPSEFTGIEYKNETAYLSDEFLERTEFLVNETKKRGMKLWLYDEGGYPSGAANGRVVRENPELATLLIDASGKTHAGPSLAQPYPDLINPKSTEKFIEYTHEKYKSYFKDTLGESFGAIFTDEAHALSFDEGLRWSFGFEDIFREKYGYDIREHFDALFDEGKLDEFSRRARADYRELLGELFSKNYFGRIKKWCDENGMLSTGHVGGDDVAFGNAKWGYYHILKCLRQMHIPGVDMIWRQAFPAPKMKGVEPYAPLCANSFFPRYASSSAHQTGARLALSESYAIYGAGMTYDQMRWVYNFQAVRGINVLNPMNMNYTHAGKYGAIAGLPNFSSPSPGCSDLAEFNLWASRVSYIMSAGKPVADSAIYMPFRDIWPADSIARKTAEEFEALGAELEKRGCDIDVIDDDAILAADILDSALYIGDASYRVLYFQPNVSISQEVSEKLDAFRKAGGKTVTLTGDYEIYPIICDKTESLRATRRSVSEGRLYYLTNEAHGAKCGEVTFPHESAEVAYEINLVTAEKRVVSVKPYKYDLSLGGEVVLLFGKEAPAVIEKTASEHIGISTLSDFEFRRTLSVKIEPCGIVSENIDEAPICVGIGDWRCFAGDDFSGDAEYKTYFEFNGEIPENAALDLGNVGYSCEVFLNGKSLGVRIFTPFVYNLSDLRAKNELVIRVSNTMANAYATAKYEEWIQDYEPDYMKKLELEFEKESLPSGLFGPVLLSW